MEPWPRGAGNKKVVDECSYLGLLQWGRVRGDAETIATRITGDLNV